MKRTLQLALLLLIGSLGTADAQTEIFNYKQAISGRPRTLGVTINTINRTTGEVVFGGTDSRGPTTPGLFFTWIWGDGTSNNGFFPQTKKYADVTKNYLAKVVSTYSATEKDTVEVLVDFVPGKVTPIPLDPKLKVYIPNQPFAVDGITRIPFTDKIFAPDARAQLEYLFQVCSQIEYDFVNGNARLQDGKFEQYMFRDSLSPGAYALSGSTPIAFGVGDVLAKGMVDYSSMCHEMGHNYTLNTPTSYTLNGRLGSRPFAFYGEAIAQIFQQAAGYELINNYQKYGIDEAVLQKLKANFMVNARYQRAMYLEYVKDGMPFSSWSKVPGYSYTDSKEAFITFLVVAYKFMETAEQQGKGYRMPMKRMMQFLQRFNADWVTRYDPQNDNAKASAFRSTLWAAAMSQAFQRDMRADFRAINFPISDADWTYLSTFETLPGVAESGKLLAFSFRKADNPTLTANVSASLLSGSIILTLPTGTSLTALRGSFVTSCSAVVGVGGVVQTSGVSVNDFSKPVVYQIVNGNAAPVSYTIEVSMQADIPGIETAVKAFMTKYDVPGLSIAILKDERLVYAKGYGLANKETGEPVTTNTTFRLGSIAKSVTAMAILKLVDEGQLTLDQRVFGPGSILGTTFGEKPYTPQLEQITVRQLLEHTAGGDAWSNQWDPANNKIDPYFQKEWLGYSQDELIGKVLDTRPVTQTPGSKFVYSNIGMGIAGRVIEKLSGMTYEAYVQNHLLGPIGVNPTIMKVGGSTLAERAANETVYYNPYPGYDQPYAFSIARLAPAGGWIATAASMARLLAGTDGLGRQRDILSPKSVRDMLTPSPASLIASPAFGYGLGCFVGTSLKASTHDGSLAGGSATWWRFDSGYTYVVAVNTRRAEGSYYGDLELFLYTALMGGNPQVGTQLMKGDQFDLFVNAASALQSTTLCSLSTTLSASSATICQGQSTTLTVSTTGGQCTPAYRWQRDGVALAGASPVVSLSAGGVYSVTVAEGNGCPGTSASVVITQKPTPDAQIAGVSVSAGGILSLSASPDGATVSHQWSLNGTALSGATSATYAVRQSGTYQVTISNDGCVGVSLPLSVNVPNSGGRMAAEPAPEKSLLTVSPNPSAGQITIRLHLPEPAPATLTLTNLAGQQLRYWPLPTPQIWHEYAADLRGLPTGTYLIVAEATGQRVVSKLLIE